MYRVICTRKTDGDIVYDTQFASLEDAVSNITLEMQYDLHDTEVYNYQLLERDGWKEKPFKVTVSLDVD